MDKLGLILLLLGTGCTPTSEDCLKVGCPADQVCVPVNGPECETGQRCGETCISPDDTCHIEDTLVCLNVVCKEDTDCGLSAGDSASSSAGDCSACEGGDRCVKDALDTTYCVTEGDAATCEAIDTEAVSLTDTDGADFTGCLVDSSCEGYTCNDA